MKNALIDQRKFEKNAYGGHELTIFSERQYSLLLSMSRDVTLEGRVTGLWRWNVIYTFRQVKIDDFLIFFLLPSSF